MTKILLKFTKGSYALNKNKFVSCHCLCTEQIKLRVQDVEEIKIPVPWGHIAGKWWGNKDIPPVLAIHGWQDNANSFDRLLPLLNIQSALAIDLPGHGYSSHLPEGKAYDFGEYVISIHRINKYYDWKKVSLLTHSFGSVLGFAYASMFPDTVKWIVNFECARSLMTAYRSNMSGSLSKGVDTLLKIEKQKKESSPPAYKLSEMIEMCLNGSLGSITSPEAALVLLRRGVYLTDKEPASAKTYDKSESDLQDFIVHEMQMAMSLPENEREELLEKFAFQQENWNKIRKNLKQLKLEETGNQYYVFRRDPSIKAQAFQSFSKESILEISKNIKCPFLSLRAKYGFLYGSTRKLYEKTLEILKTNLSYFEHHEVDGTHHAHLNSPQNLAPVINQFLEKIESCENKSLEHPASTHLETTD